MLEGYLLTGRHGFIHTYESFSRIIDSMVSQHAKWLKICKELPWRASISSLNIILSSHVWQQDHNGYTHQDPGFLNHIVTKNQRLFVYIYQLIRIHYCLLLITLVKPKIILMLL